MVLICPYLFASSVIAAGVLYVLFGPVQNVHYKDKRKLPLGLKNYGSNCYINVVLQCLSSSHSFVSWLHSTVQNQPCSKSFSSVLFSVLHAINNSECSSNIVSNFMNALRFLDKRYWNFSEQNDSHELFHKIVERVTGEATATIHGLSIAPSTSPFIKNPFRGLLATQIVCSSCMHKFPIKVEQFDSIPCPIIDASNLFGFSTIEQCLEHFLHVESIYDFHCEACNSETLAYKNQTIVRLPSCLCISVQRTLWNDGLPVKDHRYVAFPHILYLDKFVQVGRHLSKSSKFKSFKFKDSTGNENLLYPYELRAAIVHYGHASSGHYVAYRRDFSSDENWILASDEAVRNVSISEVLSSKVFMLFYDRCK